MRMRLDGLLAGTAVAVALALTCFAGYAFAQSSNDTPNASQPQVSGDPSPSVRADPPPPVDDLSPPAASTEAAKAATPVEAAKPVAPPSEVTSTVPPPSVKAADKNGAVAEKLRDLLAAGKFDRILGARRIAASSRPSTAAGSSPRCGSPTAR